MAIQLILISAVVIAFAVGYVYGHVRGSSRGFEVGRDSVEVIALADLVDPRR